MRAKAPERHRLLGAPAETVAGTAVAGRRAAERAARESYGRLVALLAYRWRDLAAAEDALGDALAAALQHWPRDGVPAVPDAWLLKAAQRRLLHAARHARVENDPAVLALFDGDAATPSPPAVPDERLRLLFVCAHPAVPEAMRAPLMLQAVLGVHAQAIADAYLVSPAAMAQRLVRVKAAIRDAGVGYDEPEARELPVRLASVLESIYGAYTIGSNDALDGAARGGGSELAEEAVYLARLVVALQPAAGEALGLLALLLHCEARRSAQFDADGRFVPLAQQDVASWRADLHAQADHFLWRAARIGRPGRFQIEAAIHSAHSQRRYGGGTPWAAIAQLHGVLSTQVVSVGARTGHAVALAEAGDVGAGLALLAGLPADVTQTYAPFWVAKAHLERLGGRIDAADAALRRAIGLTEDRRVRDHLLAQIGTGVARDASSSR